MARPSRQRGQKQIVHLDDVVEQRLAGLEQVAGDEGVAFGRRKAPQIAGVVAPAEFAGLSHKPRIETVEPGSGTEQVPDQAPAADVSLDDAGIGGTRIILEPKQTGAGIAGRHFEQQIDRFPQCARQVGGDRLEQLARGLRRRGIDDAFERARRRQHDLPAAQRAFRQRQKFGGAAALGGPKPQPLPQPGSRALAEGAQAQIAANALGLLALGRFTFRRAEKEDRRQLELARQVIDDPQRRLPVIVEEPAMGAHHTELQRKTAFVIGTPALTYLPQVGRRQAPVPREFVLARIGEDAGAAPDRRPEGRIRGRH